MKKVCKLFCLILFVFLFASSVQASTSKGDAYGLFIRGFDDDAAMNGITIMKKITNNNLLYDQKKITTFAYNSETLEKKGTTEANIKKLIKNTFKGAGKNDTGILYFTTHGSESGLLLQGTVELKQFNLAEGWKQTLYGGTEMSYYSLAKALADTKCGKIIVVIDACHSYSFVTNGVFKLKNSSDRDRFLVITASNADQSAWFVRNCFFKMTWYLHEGLGTLNGNVYADANNDGKVTMGELFSYLRYPTYNSISWINWGGTQLPMFYPTKDENRVVFSYKVSNNPTNKTTLKLDKSSVSIYQKGTATIKATVGGKKGTVKWKSSNTTVATVNAKGKVTGKKAGTSTITATVNGVQKSCKVTVKKPTIKLNKTSVSVQAGKTVTLKPTIQGASKTVTWTSSNKKIAMVSNKGVVKGVEKGTVIITAKANGVTAKCKVTVKKAKKKVYSEKEMYQMVSKNRGIAGYMYADFDGNGTKEMFVTSVADGSDLEGVYFVNSEGKITRVASGKKRNLGIITLLSGGKNYYSTGGKGFYFVDYNNNGTMWGDRTLLFGVKNNKPYELKLSGILSGFYTDNGVYTVRQYMAEHHVFMRTRLIYDSATQEFKFGEDLGEW